MLILLGLTPFSVLQTNVRHAEDTRPTEVNVTGTWKAKVEVAGQTGEPIFNLKQDGNKITGTYQGLLGQQEVTGTIIGDKLEFGFTTDQGNIDFTGSIKNDGMDGEAHYGDTLSGKWTATRQYDVTGTWKTKVDVAGQTGEPTFKLNHKGDTITGKYHGSFGEKDVIGTLKGNKIEFGITLDQGKVVYIGTINADTMKGEAKYGDFTGVWNAEREKVKQEKAKEEAEPSKVNDNTSNVQKTTFEYAEKNSQKLFLDRFVDTSAKVEGKRPIIIFSVGGGWENGGRGDSGKLPLFNYLTSLGYTMISIDYRAGIKNRANGDLAARRRGTKDEPISRDRVDGAGHVHFVWHYASR
jgi:hypothetical protein